MSRVPLVAGNWKMFKTVPDALALVEDLLALLGAGDGAEVAVCPPFTALADVGRRLAGTRIRLGAQDLFWETEGAYTGEVSPAMLADLGCRYVIVGHSERRQHFGETDEAVARKAGAAFDAGLVPIVCVGERLEERDRGHAEEVVLRQTTAATEGLQPERIAELVIAYEPVWAIGTGRAATGAEANRMIGLVREALRRRAGDAADATRIQYGGSVKPDNAAEFLAQPEVDGALVGGASLDARTFVAIVAAAG